MDVENNGPLYKRPVGRPPKERATRGVQIELGTFSLPGTIRQSTAQHVGPFPPAPPPLSHSGSAKRPVHVTTPADPANHTTSGCPSTPHIIPEENPQQEVELDEDEQDGVGDGIGDDDEGDDEDGDEDGSSGPRGGDASSSTHKPDRSRHPLPPWLQRAFEAAVAQCECRDSEGFPVLIPGITHSGYGHRQHISTSKAIARRPPLSMDRSFSCGMSRPFTRIFDVLTATTHLTATLLSHDPGDASASTCPFGLLGTVTVAADASTQKARSTP